MNFNFFHEKYLKIVRIYGMNILSDTQETFEVLSHFLYNMEVILKEYKNNEQLIDYLISRNVTIENKLVLQNINTQIYIIKFKALV